MSRPPPFAIDDRLARAGKADTSGQCRKARELLELDRRLGRQPAGILMFESRQLAQAGSVSTKRKMVYLEVGVTFSTNVVTVPRPKAWRGL